MIKGDAPVAPYYIPLGEDGQPAKFLKAKPKTDLTRCDHCGKCAKVCPMGSINPDNTDEVPGICIKCQACIQYCPQGAKYFDDPRFLSHKAMLERVISGRRIGSILKGVLLTQHPFVATRQPEHIASAICSLLHPIHPMIFPQGSHRDIPFHIAHHAVTDAFIFPGDAQVFNSPAFRPVEFFLGPVDPAAAQTQEWAASIRFPMTRPVIHRRGPGFFRQDHQHSRRSVKGIESGSSRRSHSSVCSAASPWPDW